MLPDFVICGVEHSGTTLISDLFRQVPTLDSGFEVGVLLCDSPREFLNFEPFARNLKGGWGIGDQDLEYICDTEKLEEFYARLFQKSTLLKEGCTAIFDKTPRYFSRLSECLNRVPVRFIASYKDPRSIVFSDYNKSGRDDFSEWYAEYYRNKHGYLSQIYDQYLKAKSGEFGDRVFLVSLESICLDTRRTTEKMFDFIGRDFSLSYLGLQNVRFGQTRAPYISTNIPFEYLNCLSKEQISIIDKDFSNFDEWFYE